MRFLPREEKFFTLFNKQANLISESAGMLREGLHNGLHGLPEAAKFIQKLEEQGDELSITVTKALNDTFITPIDPEDIQSLTSKLDAVLNLIEDTAHRLVSYKVSPIPKPMVEQCDIILAAAKLLVTAFDAFAKGKPFDEECREIIRLEERSDFVDRSAVAALFEEESNPITVMKFREVYDFLEATTDAFQHVAVELLYITAKIS